MTYVGGYGDMFTTHLCEHDDCTKGSCRGPHFEAQGCRCPDHDGVHPYTCTDCRKIGYRGDEYEGYRCPDHGGVNPKTCSRPDHTDCEK